MPTKLALGKQPATHDDRDLRLSNYLAPTATLPRPPRSFGHETVEPAAGWGMLGNDRYGDCVFAGAAHETMLWNAVAGRQVQFDDAAVLSDYAAVTGFDPSTGQGDNGTNVRDALNYRRQTGIIDAGGTRHRIGAYVALDPGDVTQLYQALYLFEAVAVGIRFPSSAMAQFNAGQTWTLRSSSPIEGGHYVPIVAHRSRPVCVTWGQLQPMTYRFYQYYTDEAWALLSEEMLTGGKSVEGLDLDSLRRDIAAL